MTAPPALLADALRDRYTIERELGSGGMATVYLAEDLRHSRLVALKVLRPELAISLGSERFLREIEIAASLSHPHILPLLDSGTLPFEQSTPGRPYYVMPFVEGESLRDRLEREKQLPLEDVLVIAQQVADALGYAHDHGIVHRDVKPENILLQPGHALVADFGIARAIEVVGGSRLTESGLAIGTPAYMSPEQGTGDAVDGRTDIYALGCVVYEMLVGEPPYTGPSAAAIIARRLSEPVPSLRVVRDGVPLAVEQAVHRALARSPADRFPTAMQFATALTMPGASVPSRRTVRVRPLLMSAALGLMIAGAFIAPEMIRRLRATVIPAANLIAVLPLTPATPDTALERLGQNLVITLSTNLDGLGGMHPIDPLTVLAQVHGGSRGYSTLGQAVELGRRFGASGVVRGALTRDGTRVRLYLALYATGDSAIVAQADVSGSPDSVAAITDAITLALLQKIWRARDPPTPSLAAVTTKSIPALRSFLDGEQAITKGLWAKAESAYADAIAEDSLFWLAHWRHSYARWWESGGALDTVDLRVPLAHMKELPEKERLLLQAWTPRRSWPTTQSLDRAHTLTERFPDYWPGWFEYADQLCHGGPLLGIDLRQASVAFQRVVQLNPPLVPALEHLSIVALQLQDTVLFKRTMRQRDTLWPSNPRPVDRAEVMVVELLMAVLRGRAFDGALADSVVGYAASFEDPRNQVESTTWFSRFGLPATQIAMSRRVLAQSTAPYAAVFQQKGMALAWAARGAWDSAVIAMDKYARQSASLARLTPEQMRRSAATAELAKLDDYSLSVVGAWLGALDPEVAMARRDSAAEAMTHLSGPMLSIRQLGTGHGPTRRAQLYWFDGILAVSQRDLEGLRQAKGRLLKEDRTSQPLLRSLNAFELELLGRRREAADSMAALSLEYWNWAEPYFIGINRLAAARWLISERDPDQAARLLVWPQAILYSLDFVQAVVILGGLSYLELARAESARGNQGLAQQYFGQFLQRYDMPSARMQHLVAEAKLEARE